MNRNQITLLFLSIIGALPSIKIFVVIFILPVISYFGFIAPIHHIVNGVDYIPSLYDDIILGTIVFTNIWTGGHLIDTGQIDILWNNDAFRDYFWSHTSYLFGPNIWSYPPPYMLVACILAAFPILVSYIIWQSGNILLTWWSMKKIGFPTWVLWSCLVFGPATMTNLRAGHNGSLFGILLFLGMYFLCASDNLYTLNGIPVQHKKYYPYLSGIMFGLLFMKPPFAIMMPFILLAVIKKHNGIRIALSCLITVCILFLMTLICFGWKAWIEFFHITSPTMSAFLQRPWTASSEQVDFANPFIAFRSLGCSLTISWILQGLVSCICGYIIFKLWKSDNNSWMKIFISLPLVILITPYAHDYDMVICGVTSTYLLWNMIMKQELFSKREISIFRPFVMIAWILPGFGALFSYSTQTMFIAAKMPFIETMNMAFIAYTMYHFRKRLINKYS